MYRIIAQYNSTYLYLHMGIDSAWISHNTGQLSNVISIVGEGAKGVGMECQSAIICYYFNGAFFN